MKPRVLYYELIYNNMAAIDSFVCIFTRINMFPPFFSTKFSSTKPDKTLHGAVVRLLRKIPEQKT